MKDLKTSMRGFSNRTEVPTRLYFFISITEKKNQLHEAHTKIDCLNMCVFPRGGRVAKELQTMEVIRSGSGSNPRAAV